MAKINAEAWKTEADLAKELEEANNKMSVEDELEAIKETLGVIFGRVDTDDKS